MSVAVLPKVHPYIPNSNPSIASEMLSEIGVRSVEELFKDIPSVIRSKASLDVPTKMSEMEVRRHLEKLLGKNLSTRDLISFLGAGVWRHHIPAAVDAIVGRSEFLTSYTPYQPEISQGMLQSMFEYQSLVCDLTAMEYSNSSMYDWSTALGEAARMAVRVTGRDEFIVPHYIHPERLSTLRLFTEPADIGIAEVAQDRKTGEIDLGDLKRKVGPKTAGVYVEYPSFLGFVEEEMDDITQVTHSNGSLFVVGVEPVSLGILKPPGEFEVDIVVGEGQPLGSHMNYGGPLLGIFACRGDALLRQMPGRMIGKTKTQDGKQDAYCMAIQTREQHIRREKATSNICTNEALLALAASTYLSLMGPKGMEDICSTILENCEYATAKLQEIPGIKTPAFDAFHFMEFTVNFDETRKKVSEINDGLLKAGIQGGLDVSKYFPELGETALYCCTEIHTHNDIDVFAENLRQIVGA
jgi:glycine dehydrogenase subunit 1